jgi:hypothetical protein
MQASLRRKKSFEIQEEILQQEPYYFHDISIERAAEILLDLRKVSGKKRSKIKNNLIIKLIIGRCIFD